MRVADTSALYAFVTTTDPHHREALEAVTAPEPILVPAEIWSETVALLQYRTDFRAATAAGAALRALPNIEIQPTWDDPFENILGEAWRIYQAAEGRLSHPDAVVVAWCRKRKLRPLTFDEEITRAAA